MKRGVMSHFLIFIRSFPGDAPAAKHLPGRAALWNRGARQRNEFRESQP